MWLTVEHVTRFAYDASINEAYSEIRLKPAHRDGQRCSSFALATEPRGVSIAEYRDRFGNVVHHFDVLESHQNLVVTARSEVWTPEVFVDDEAAPSLLDRWDLLRESRYVPLEGSVAELAATVDSSEPTLETAHALMTAVRGRMKYETGSTHVRTLADEALSAGHGVCQDFAHVLIGVCRLHGIPARYVSGYLYDPRASGNGNSASHAWVDVWEPRARLGLARSDARPRADRPLRAGRRRPRLRRRPSDPGRLQGQGEGGARGRRADPRALAQRTAAAIASSSAGVTAESSSIASAICQRERSGSPISFETALISIAGTPARLAARRTPNPSIASTATSRPTLPTAALVPIGSVGAAGSTACAAASSRASAGARSTSAIAAARSQ